MTTVLAEQPLSYSPICMPCRNVYPPQLRTIAFRPGQIIFKCAKSTLDKINISDPPWMKMVRDHAGAFFKLLIVRGPCKLKATPRYCFT